MTCKHSISKFYTKFSNGMGHDGGSTASAGTGTGEIVDSMEDIVSSFNIKKQRTQRKQALKANNQKQIIVKMAVIMIIILMVKQMKHSMAF